MVFSDAQEVTGPCVEITCCIALKVSRADKFYSKTLFLSTVSLKYI